MKAEQQPIRENTSATALKLVHQSKSQKKRIEDLKILMAEDNLVNQKLAELLFRKLSVSPTIVSNGKEAVEAVREKSYDIVFMDVFMPEMDGIEATIQLKNLFGVNCPHIVALTANTMTGDRERMLEAGMDEYMPKPIDFSKLKELLQRYAMTS